jgi:NAD(P)-dependent dehydrogenase (short-subunit alcohol dehydrogenase family)
MMSKYAIVTGNERGIGKALTVDLAKQGYNVLVNCLKARKTANKLSKNANNMV